MAATTTDTTTTQAASTEPEAETVTMTQGDLTKLVSDRVAAAVAQAQRKAAQIKPEEREELDRLRAAERAAEQKRLEEKGEYEKATEARVRAVKDELEAKLTTTAKTAEAARGRLEKALIDNALLAAATEHNAIDAQDVAALLRSRVKLDESMDGVVVHDVNGVQAYAKGGAPMTVAQLVESFLESKPHLVRATTDGKGGGAGGGRTVVTGDTSAIEEIDAKIKAAKDRVIASRNTDTKAMNEVLALTDEKKRLEAGA